MSLLIINHHNTTCDRGLLNLYALLTRLKNNRESEKTSKDREDVLFPSTSRWNGDGQGAVSRGAARGRWLGTCGIRCGRLARGSDTDGRGDLC